MSLALQHVTQQYVAQVWPEVSAYLSRSAYQSGGDVTLDQIRMHVNLGMWMLLVVLKGDKITGAITVAFNNLPNARVAMVTATGGTHVCNPEVIDQLRKIVKSMGATTLQAVVRPAMVRLLGRSGFKPRATVVETSI